jgi:hypothetical protein
MWEEGLAAFARVLAKVAWAAMLDGVFASLLGVTSLLP